MGVPSQDINNAATLLGQKLTINEFVAFQNLTNKSVPIITAKGLLIISIAICGFANFSSVGMQIGGIGALGAGAPNRSCKAWIKSIILRYTGILSFCNYCRYFNVIITHKKTPRNKCTEFLITSLIL